jgi:putative ABC transport system permease protein
MTFLRLVRLFVLRNMREEKFLTSLSVIGISLGIALFIGVRVASDRATTSFDAAVRGVALTANYEVIDISGIDFDEGIYPVIRRIEENAFPVVTADGYLPRLKETIRINGIYTVKAGAFPGLHERRRYDMENFYRLANGVFITKSFSEEYSVREGETVRPLVYDSEYPMKVVGIIEDQRIPANTVVMDLGNFQEYFGKVGYLTRIDLKTDDRKAAKIRDILLPNLAIQKKQEAIANREALLKSFGYNLQFVSLIAILVGLFLLYNTVFISVVKRRAEIGVLRGLGTDRRTVVLLFIMQGLLMGVAGSIGGIVLGQAAAYFSVLAVERTISTMFSPLSISDYFISGKEALVAIAAGILVSLIASAVPAFESSRIRPNESMREGSFEGRYKRRLKTSLTLGPICLIAGMFASYMDYRSMPFEFPFLAYCGIVLIIAGFTFLCPSFLTAVLKAGKGIFERTFRGTGRITAGDMAGNIYRFSVAVMSVAVSAALVIALFTLIFSFRNSLKEWIHRNISADAYIKPASCTSNFCFFPLPGEVLKVVEGIPGVKRVDRFRALSLDFHGRKVVAGFGSREKRSENKVVGVSRYLAMRYGLKKGGSLELQTPRGRKSFVIENIFSSYSTTSGFLYLDREWLKQFWGLDDATQLGIYLKRGVDAERFVSTLRNRLSGRYSLEIMNNVELRRKVLGIFDRTFAITYAIELIAIIVSLMGVINTLLALVLERKREISIIRYLGGTWRQIGQLLLLSAGVVGVSGIIWGTLLGALLSVIFIDVINTISFGWEVRFNIPVLYLSLVMSALFLTTLVASLLPSRVARRIDPKRFVSFE